MNISLFLSQRFKHAKHENGFIGFVSKASSIGIGLGVAVLIIVLSVINGFEDQMVNRLLSVVPHIEYEAPNTALNNWPNKVEKIKRHPSVIAVAPFIKLNAMAQYKNKLKGLELKGVAPQQEILVSDIQSYIKGFDLINLKENEIIMGKQIVDAIGAKKGDDISLLIPKLAGKKGRLQPPTRIKLTLVAIIEMGGPADNTAYMSLSQAQSVLQLEKKQTKGLRLKIDDIYKANMLAREIGATLDAYVYYSSWERSQGHLYQDIQMVRMIIYLVVSLIIAVASFNIVSSLVMEVKEKESDIAILKTMGGTDMMIIKTFVFQGLSQAFSGIFWGGLCGVVIAIYIPDIFNFYSELIGHNVLTGVYFVEFLPSKLEIMDVIVTLVATLVMTVIATVYPSWQASKIDPAKVLGQ